MSSRLRPLFCASFCLGILSCAGSQAATPAAVGQTHHASNQPRSDPAETPPAAGAPDSGDQGGQIAWYEDGELRGRVTPEGAERRGLTVIELGDEWAPFIFHEEPSLGERGHQPYRRRFLRLADEQTGRRRPGDDDRHLELFGIFPTLRVVRERLADERRHECHSQVDDGSIEALDELLRPGGDVRAQRARSAQVRAIERELSPIVEQRGLASIADLAGERRYRGDVERWQRLSPTVRAIRAVQEHLRCERWLASRAQADVVDAWTGQAIRIWQRRHMIIALGGSIDSVTRQSFGIDSRELDFLTLLRVMRERVADAGGLIEDGSASAEWGTIAGRRVDLDDEFHWVSRLGAMDGGAPDLISQATDAAVRHLGWNDPASATAWLQQNMPTSTPSLRVAVRLPPKPAYHSAHMDLFVRIDRGDVFYGLPYTEDGRPRGFTQRNRPITTIYVRHEGREIPLVRWNTTIGSWQPEVNPEGGVGLRYKESDVGARVWRDVIASPSWLPPPSTPDDELLRRGEHGWVPHRSITGPGYDSAYGLAMVIHHIQRGEGTSDADFADNGIRSHGSVNYRSILRGYSHGCHRLFNHLAVRMTSFLLRHRTHRVHGAQAALFRRQLQPEAGEDGVTPDPVVLEIDTRGFRYELTPPVPVEVRRGNVRGGNRAPQGFFPLPEQLQAQALQEAATDPATN